LAGVGSILTLTRCQSFLVAGTSFATVSTTSALKPLSLKRIYYHYILSYIYVKKTLVEIGTLTFKQTEFFEGFGTATDSQKYQTVPNHIVLKS
jgi:hypothetical protein